MMLLDHVHEGLEQPYCNLISTLIIVTVTWEVALGLEAERETGLITNDVYKFDLSSASSLLFSSSFFELSRDAAAVASCADCCPMLIELIAA